MRNPNALATRKKDSYIRIAGHIIILLICVGLIWGMVEDIYRQQGYSAPIPEIRFDHDCMTPPEILFRAVVENNHPMNLALFTRIDNFTSISSGCSYIDIFLIPHGSKAVVVDQWAQRLSKESYFRTANGRGFALRFLMDGSGQHTPSIEFSDAIHRRSIEHSFFWLHFSSVSYKHDSISAMLKFEFNTSEYFLIDKLSMRNGASGSIFGHVAEVRLHNNQGFVIDLRNTQGEYWFALLNILIGVLAAIGTGSLIGLCRICVELVRES